MNNSKIMAIIDYYGQKIDVEKDIKTSEAREIIKSSLTDMGKVGNGYIYGCFKANQGMCDTKKLPVLNIRMMSDEEWNKLANKNMMEGSGCCE